LKPKGLAEWLAHLESLHPQGIALGLERVAKVAARLGLAPRFPVITVGGTNGKGSTCAYLDAILSAQGLLTGCYTSPHLVRYNERVRIGGRDAGDAQLIEAFVAVEAARGGVPLTYFEFGTLAALWNFREAGVAAAILEVGLGGRLDAVNAFDPDCAVVASIDLDHQEWLGDSREAIGFEKAGIFRSGRPAVCSDPRPPESLLAHAGSIGADLRLFGRDFRAVRGEGGWRFESDRGAMDGLPLPPLRGMHQLANAAGAVAALESLFDRLQIGESAIRTGLSHVQLAGRFQVLPGWPRVILDVAHNPAAARALSENLEGLESPGRLIAVFGMLADKDVEGVLDVMAARVDLWLAGEIEAGRRMPIDRMRRLLEQRGLPNRCFPSLRDAWSFACKEAGEVDTILVFGSFYTVGAVMKAMAEMRGA
jgi:dihydrofolate synthase/folylpolyglutamate synthase